MNEMIQKEDLLHSLGLSCVENYLLAVCKNKLNGYESLFCESFLTFDDILSEFFEKETEYAYFEAIPRIQTTAKNMGIISFEWMKQQEFIVPKDGYLCIRVKKTYMTEKYKTALWRGDHFFMVFSEGNGEYTYLNDSPCDKASITKEELFQLYDGEYIHFSLLEKDISNQRETCEQIFYDTLKKSSREIKIKAPDIMKIRDVLGVLRVVRRRMEVFLSYRKLLCNSIKHMDTDLIKEDIAHLDRAYIAMEYMQKRNRLDITKIQTLMEEIRTREKEMLTMIRNRRAT